MLQNRNFAWKCLKQQVRLGIEPRTSRVWGERDNHYTTEPWTILQTFTWSIIIKLNTFTFTTIFTTKFLFCSMNKTI